MALSGDTKKNYIQLQQTTGERYSSIADRLTTEEAFLNLDARGRAGNQELADWLRKQSDDEDAILRVTDPTAYAARERGSSTDRSSSPKDRNQGNKGQQNG